jgi:uncharacterized DUF497 family protein
LDFVDAEKVFGSPTATAEDSRVDYGEQRLNTIGLLGVKVVVITHTETDEIIHIISMFEAVRHETEPFFSRL